MARVVVAPKGVLFSLYNTVALTFSRALYVM